MTYAPKNAGCPCIGVICVPCVHRLTAGQVCARPSSPAPSAENSALPIVQCTASAFGCARPDLRIALYAYADMATKTNGSRAEKKPPIGSQYEGTPMK